MHQPFPSWRFAIVAALLVLVPLSSCGGQRSREEAAIDAKQQIRSIITEPSRAERLLAQIDLWDATLAAKQKTDAEYLARRDALNSDYTATPEAFRALQAAQSVVIDGQLTRFLAIRAAIIADTTPDEWRRLSSLRDELRTGSITSSEGTKP